MKQLTEKITITLLPSEKVLCVQRQHWLAILFSLIIHALIVLGLTIMTLLFVYLRYPSVFQVAMLDFSLFILTLLATFGTFLVMNWYFNFYIITSKRIIHEHFFKVSGNYYEEVFLQENIESADRIEKNIFYDLLGIEDVKVHFASYERIEPFIFQSPENPQEIESIIDEFSTHHKEGVVKV